MNILYLINHAGKGGSEKYVELLADEFKKDNNIFFVYNEDGPLREKMEALGIFTKQIEMKNPFDQKAAAELSEYCEDNDIDVIHAQFPRENFIALAVKNKNPGIKVIYTSHVNIENNFLWKIFNKKKSKNNDCVISVCNKNKELLIENGFPEEKIEIIHNGIEISLFPPEKKDNIRKELGIKPETFVFVTITRFTPEKGVEFLLDSVAKYKELGGDSFKVLLVGDGPDEEDLKNLAEELDVRNQVLWLGYRSDIDDILLNSDCYINSSESEALSIAILEALNKGLPLIATKVGGNPDIIDEKKPAGILVRYESTAAMARAMEKMQWDEDFYKKACENALFTVKSRFDISEMLSKTYNIYKEGKCKND